MSRFPLSGDPRARFDAWKEGRCIACGSTEVVAEYVCRYDSRSRFSVCRQHGLKLLEYAGADVWLPRDPEPA